MQPQLQEERDTYREAVAAVMKHGIVDRSVVTKATHVGTGEAFQLIARMQEDGFVSTPKRKDDVPRVLVTADLFAEHFGAPLELDAETRALLELIIPTLPEREELKLDGIHTEFQVETETARDCLLELARRNLIGKPDGHGTSMVLVSSNGNGKVTRLKAAPSPPPPPRAATPAKPAKASNTRQCEWPGCERTDIFGHGMCSRDYFRANKCRKEKGKNAPWPTIAQAVAWWDARDHSSGKRAARKEPPVLPAANAKAAPAPPPSPPPAPEKPWQTQVAEARRLASENAGLRHTIARLEREAHEHEAVWKTLADFIERQPTLRRLLHLR